MSISGAPLSSTPIAGALALSSGTGTITLAPASVTATWVVPTQTLSGSGSATALAPAAVIATWVVPTQTITLAGSITLPTATATWVVPSQTIAASGSATLAPASVIATWVVPSQNIVGGDQGTGGAAEYWRYMGNFSADKAFAIVKSDTVDFPVAFNGGLTDTIYCGGSGVVRVVFQDDSTVDYTVAAGTTLFVSAKRVNSTGTTATLLVAQYRI